MKNGIIAVKSKAAMIKFRSVFEIMDGKGAVCPDSCPANKSKEKFKPL